jgi:uncharacterized protein YabN with tetrapyrrole methylase and pyrophosphatase domain
MVRRHPHVFGGHSENEHSSDSDGESLIASWEEIKRAEKAAKVAAGRSLDESPFAGVVEASGSLSYASAILSKSAKSGHTLDLPDSTAADLESVQDLGLHLLHTVAECRRRKLDAEVVLREAARSFRASVESEIRKRD